MPMIMPVVLADLILAGTARVGAMFEVTVETDGWMVLVLLLILLVLRSALEEGFATPISTTPSEDVWVGPLSGVLEVDEMP